MNQKDASFIEKIQTRLPLNKLPSEVAELLADVQHKQQTIAIACSGGADSVFLVRWYAAWFPGHLDQLCLLHFNHKTRGMDSDHDANFVETLGTQLNLRVFTGEIQNHDDIEQSQDEASLRKERMDFFAKAAESRNIQLILTAHHLEDRVESLLMRLSRASAVDGLIAPKTVQSFRSSGTRFARPLIHLRKSTLVETLKSIGQTWREDASNAKSDYYRNFIRNDLLPLWETKKPESLIENIGASLQKIEEDAECLNKLTLDAVYSLNLKDMNLQLQRLDHHPISIVKRAIWMWLNERKISQFVTHQQVEHLIQAPAGCKVSITTDQWLSKNGDGSLCHQIHEPHRPFLGLQFQITSTSQLYFPDGTTLRSERITNSPHLYKQICKGEDDRNQQIYINADILNQNNATSLVVKFWEDGMQYVPFGSAHRKKIKSCFIDRKIDSDHRRRLPIVCSSTGEILWIPGLEPSEKTRITSESKLLLRLTYQQT